MTHFFFLFVDFVPSSLKNPFKGALLEYKSLSREIKGKEASSPS